MVTIWSQMKKRGYDESRNPLILLVPRDGIEPPTRGFSVRFDLVMATTFSYRLPSILL